MSYVSHYEEASANNCHMKIGHLALIFYNLDNNYSSLHSAEPDYFLHFGQYIIHFTIPLEDWLIWICKAGKKTWEK